MKLNIAYPTSGAQKVIEIDDENRLRCVYDKRISQEVEGDLISDDFKGYLFKISGGNDKQGFAMQQGVLTTQRVRLLVDKDSQSYRPRKRGERKRKSVRGCIVSSDLSILNLVVIKKGEKDIEGLTDIVKPRHLGPKRASKIRKLFNLDKVDDVRKYVIRREILKDGKKAKYKAPKIQRLVTPRRLQRKRHEIAVKKQRYEKTKAEAEVFNELMSKRSKEQRDARHAKIIKKRTESAARKATTTSAPVAVAKPVVAAKPVKSAAPVVAAKPAAKVAPKAAAKPAPKK